MIRGVGLYSASGQPIQSTLSGDSVTVRISFENKKLILPAELVVGYVIRDLRGMEIASGNNIGEGTVLMMDETRDVATCSVSFTIPFFHAGSYAISPAVSYRNSDGTVIVADRLENCVIFDIVSRRPVHVLMTLPADYSLE